MPAISRNAEVAELCRSIADLLDVLGERFKPEAYRRAARSIDSLTEDISDVAARGELRTIPGVGEAIDEKIQEFLKTGHLAYHERLQKEVPAGVIDLLRIPGLGPKTARRFWKELGVEGPAELTTAIANHKLDGVTGFGPRKIQQIREALAAATGPTASGRMPIEVAYPVAHRLYEQLRTAPGVNQLEIAGSFRRCRETVGDLDILVTSEDPEPVFDAFSALPEIAEVRLRGPTKETVILSNGLQVDLRVVEPAAFGAASLYFTGSKDHNVHLRGLARDRGLKINEYGIYRGEKRLGGRTEEEMYAALGLAFIPPEIREDRGEIEAAAKGPLPTLVDGPDLRGDLHVHLPADAKGRDVDALVAAGKARHLAYVGCVVAGIAADGTRFALEKAALDRIRSLGKGAPTLLPVVEVAVGGKGPASIAPEFRYAIARPTRDAPEPTGAGAGIALVAHVGGGAAARWIPWARSVGAASEVGPGSDRLDSIAGRTVLEGGGTLGVVTGLGFPEGDPTGPISLGFARRAGAPPDSVRNAQPADAILTRASGAARPG